MEELREGLNEETPLNSTTIKKQERLATINTYAY